MAGDWRFADHRLLAFATVPYPRDTRSDLAALWDGLADSSLEATNCGFENRLDDSAVTSDEGVDSYPGGR